MVYHYSSKLCLFSQMLEYRIISSISINLIEGSWNYVENILKIFFCFIDNCSWIPMCNGPWTFGQFSICVFLSNFPVKVFLNFTLFLYLVHVILFSCCTFSMLHPFNTLSKCPSEMHPFAFPVNKFTEITSAVPNYTFPANKWIGLLPRS